MRGRVGTLAVAFALVRPVEHLPPATFMQAWGPLPSPLPRSVLREKMCRGEKGTVMKQHPSALA